MSIATNHLQKLSELRELSAQQTAHSRDMSSVACVILGGGQGTRLFPLTQSRCKPAILFGGRYHLIDVPISNALNSGVSKIFVLTQFLARSLHKHIFHTYRRDTFTPGFIEVLSAEQKPNKHAWFQGTADAVRQNIEYLLEIPTEYYLILAGDQLYKCDFRKMVDCLEQTNVDVLVGTIAVSEKDASRMGIMKVNEDFHIIDFCEKPTNPQVLDKIKTPNAVLRKMGIEETRDKEYLGSTGMYLFRKSALINLLQQDPRDDFGKHLIPTQVKNGSIAAYVHDGYWEDIGTIESFYNANMALNQEDPPFSCHDDEFPIFSHKSELPGPRFCNTRVRASTICEGSIIEAEEISNSILGQRSIIGKGSIIKDSYIMGNDFQKSSQEFQDQKQYCIEEECIIQKAIIDRNVHIGKRVKLINKNNLHTYDSSHVFIRDGIIVVAKGASIPDDFVL